MKELGRIIGFSVVVVLSPLFLLAQPTPELPVFKVYNLTGLNSPGMDFSPVMVGDELIFTTEREFDYLNYGENRFKISPFLNVQSVKVTTMGDSLKFSKPFLFSKQFFSPSHTGPVCFNETGSTAIITQVPYLSKKKRKGKVIKPQLYEAYKDQGRWKGFHRLPFCDLDFSYGHPALSPDGNKLFFAADLPQGKGGKDIYYVQKQDTAWSKPVNLGGKVNTGSNEMYPCYFSEDTLFFSSDRRGSIGGLDIYYSVFFEGDWTEPVHLDSIINSTADDFGVWFNNDNTGYFSSNRKGGVGADDLYYFQVKWPEIDEGNKIAGFFDFKSLSNDIPQKLKVFLLSEDGELLRETTTDNDGYFVFNQLPDDQGYLLKTNPVTDAELVLVDDDGKHIVRLVSNGEGIFVYKKLENDEFGKLSLLYEEDGELPQKTLSGQFNYKTIEGDKPEDLKVFLVDEDGVIVFTTTADSRGFFKFKNLPKEEHYMVKIEAQDAPLEMVLFSDSTIAELKSNDKGEFVYVKLSKDAINSLELLSAKDSELDFADFYTSLTAQFRYKSDKQKLATGITIELLDASKNVIKTFNTDSAGIIKVDSLLSGQNSFFRIAENNQENNDDIEMVILDIDDYAVAVLNQDANRIFVYRPLRPDKTSGLSLLAEQDVEIKKVLKEISAEEIYFDLDDWRLKEEGKTSLKKLIVILEDQPQLKVEVAAHADSRGSEKYNLELTEKRANVVAEFLKREGIDDKRIITKPYGESSPIYNCNDCTEEEHTQNRRVEFRLY